MLCKKLRKIGDIILILFLISVYAPPSSVFRSIATRWRVKWRGASSGTKKPKSENENDITDLSEFFTQHLELFDLSSVKISCNLIHWLMR